MRRLAKTLDREHESRLLKNSTRLAGWHVIPWI
jgi:hypothetical protein